LEEISVRLCFIAAQFSLQNSVLKHLSRENKNYSCVKSTHVKFQSVFITLKKTIASTSRVEPNAI
jgi:hypothetical protein